MSYLRALAGKLLYFVLRLVRRAANHPSLKSLIYAARNQADFSDIWEHDKMIADKTRIDAYHQAITRNVKEGDVVVDLGTGTGILAMFAAQKRPRQIYAIDHSDIIDTASDLAKANHIDGISFVRAHSKSFDPHEKVDVIIHEQIGGRLFDENMIENICDLRDRMLRDGGIIIPAKFELFIEPISLRDEFRVPFLFENRDVHGVDFQSLARLTPDAARSGRPGRTYQRIVKTAEVEKLLCEPERLLAFDLMEIAPGSIPSRHTVSKTVVRSGSLDGLCLYFRVIFDDDLTLDTSPLSRATNWYTTIFRVRAQQVRPGDVIDCDWNMVDINNAETWTLNCSVRTVGQADRWLATGPAGRMLAQ